MSQTTNEKTTLGGVAGGEWQKAQADDASTNNEAQRARLLDELIQAQGRGVTTIEAHYDEHGRRHPGVARYVLIALAGGEA